MKTINKNRIAAAIAAIGLTALPAFSGMAQAKDHGKAKKHQDNGKHLGWEKGKGNKHDDHDKDRDRDRRTWRPTTSKNTNVQHHWTNPRPRPATRPVSSNGWRLNNTRPFGTKASAERAAALRRKLGYHTTVVWNPSRRVYEVREYHKPASYRPTNHTKTPVTTGRLVGTYYYSTQAEAAKAMRFAQSKGLRATSTYYAAKHHWVVRTYTR